MKTRVMTADQLNGILDLKQAISLACDIDPEQIDIRGKSYRIGYGRVFRVFRINKLGKSAERQFTKNYQEVLPKLINLAKQNEWRCVIEPFLENGAGFGPYKWNGGFNLRLRQNDNLKSRIPSEAQNLKEHVNRYITEDGIAPWVYVYNPNMKLNNN